MCILLTREIRQVIRYNWGGGGIINTSSENCETYICLQFHIHFLLKDTVNVYTEMIFFLYRTQTWMGFQTEPSNILEIYKITTSK